MTSKKPLKELKRGILLLVFNSKINFDNKIKNSENYLGLRICHRLHNRLLPNTSLRKEQKFVF